MSIGRDGENAHVFVTGIYGLPNPLASVPKLIGRHNFLSTTSVIIFTRHRDISESSGPTPADLRIETSSSPRLE